MFLDKNILIFPLSNNRTDGPVHSFFQYLKICKKKPLEGYAILFKTVPQSFLSSVRVFYNDVKISTQSFLAVYIRKSASLILLKCSLSSQQTI